MCKQQKNTVTMQQFHTILSKFTHEVRNSAALINCQIQLLEQTHPELLQNESWDVLREETDALNVFLGEMSLYNNAPQLRMENTAVKPFLDSICAQILPSMDYLSIQFDTQIPSCLPDIVMDKSKIRQALLNLLRNAQEAVGANGTIRFEACQQKQNLALSVSDNGTGILPEYFADLFHPFVTHKTSGTGLGLAIVAEILEAHHGSVTVRSTPGKGSIFTILLPYETP